MDQLARRAASLVVTAKDGTAPRLGAYFGIRPAAAQHLERELRVAGVLDEGGRARVNSEAQLRELLGEPEPEAEEREAPAPDPGVTPPPKPGVTPPMFALEDFRRLPRRTGSPETFGR